MGHPRILARTDQILCRILFVPGIIWYLERWQAVGAPSLVLVLHNVHLMSEGKGAKLGHNF